MIFARAAQAELAIATRILHQRHCLAGKSVSNIRLYASKSKRTNHESIKSLERDASGKIDTSKLIPASKMKVDPANQQVYDTTESTMQATSKKIKDEVVEMEMRASGRVTPDLLNPVRVEAKGSLVKLSDVATIGVRDGNNLIITVFDETVSMPYSYLSYKSELVTLLVHKSNRKGNIRGQATAYYSSESGSEDDQDTCSQVRVCLLRGELH